MIATQIGVADVSERRPYRFAMTVKLGGPLGERFRPAAYRPCAGLQMEDPGSALISDRFQTQSRNPVDQLGIR